MKALARVLLLLPLTVACGGGGEDAPPDSTGAVDAMPAVVFDAPTACAPGADPVWVDEGTPISVVVGCTARETAASDSFEMPELPEGATFDAATRTFAWTPGLDQAATLTLRVVRGGGEEGTLRVGVLDAFADPANVLVDPTTYLEEHGLPVIHLSTDPTINFETYAPATITYRGTTVVGEAKLRGQTSADYPKRSYTLKFPEATPFEEPAHGFVHRRRIAVTTTFDDNSYLRHRLAYALWNRLDAAHVQMAQMSAVLFVDGRYVGLYAVTDHVSKRLFEAQGLDSTGNLYKGDTHACNFRLLLNNDQPKTSLHQGYEKKDGTPIDGEVGAYDDLDALVSWVATSDDATFTSELSTRLVRREFEDWWLLVSLIQADDSAGKNSFLWHDLPTNKWRYVPWDFNAAFGQSYETERTWHEEPPMAYDWANGLWERLFQNDEINAFLRVRWAAALAGPFAQADVLALLDTMVEEIRPSALRDEAAWGELYRTYAGWNWRLDITNATEEWTYLRLWITDRWEFANDPDRAFP